MCRFPVLRLLASAAVFAAAVFAAAPAAAQSTPVAPTQCETCHLQSADARTSGPARDFEHDIHRTRGFSCTDCHGGDPAASDKARAKDPARGYRALNTGSAVVAACARCHSDAGIMRRYAPRQRIDQASEYATSVHGKQLAAGDTKVAICVSCHQSHGIRQVSDAKSPVYPLNVAATCAVCHASTGHMAGYKKDDGAELPIDQLAEYRKSVHYAAMTKKNDLSAPTCNDCHGNHGAAPPGVGAVTNVCGTCHAVFATRFEQSVHKEVFDRGCVECHGNHAVQPPSDAMLSGTAPGLCVTCHEADKGIEAAVQMRSGIEKLKGAIERGEGLMAGLKNAGMEVSDQELALAEARNRLTLARTEMHATKLETMQPILDEGQTIVAGVEKVGQSQEGELSWRRRGLAASLAAILFVVVALALKIREQDRRHGVGRYRTR